MARLEFTIPDENAPGYLRRVRQALEFRDRTMQGMTPALVDEMVTFLVEFVTVPADRNEAREALWDASRVQFLALFDAVAGGGADPNA